MSFISKAFEYFAASPAKADPVPESIAAEIDNNIIELQAETDVVLYRTSWRLKGLASTLCSRGILEKLVSVMNHVTKRGRSRSRKQETPASGSRKTRSSKHIVEQNLEQSDLSKDSNATEDGKKTMTSVAETLPDQYLQQAGESQGSVALVDQKKSKGSVVGTRQKIRLSGKADMDKAQCKAPRNNKKQQKVLTEYIHSVSSKSGSDSSCHSNDTAKLPPLTAEIPKTRSGRKINKTKTDKKQLLGKENLGIHVVEGRQGRPRTGDNIQKDLGFSEESLAQNTSKWESIKESSGSSTSSGASSKCSSSGIGVPSTSKKGERTADVTVKSTEKLQSKTSSPKKPTASSLSSTPKGGIKTRTRGKMSLSYLSDGRSNVTTKSPVLSRPKKNSPKTVAKGSGFSPLRGAHRMARGKLPSRRVSTTGGRRGIALKTSTRNLPKITNLKSPNSSHKEIADVPSREFFSPDRGQSDRMKTPVLSRSKTNSPTTPVMKSTCNSPGVIAPKTPTKQEKIPSPVVSYPDQKSEKIRAPLLSRTNSDLHQALTLTKTSRSLDMLGSPGEKSLSASRGSSAGSSPVSRRQSREYVDRYGEGTSGMVAGRLSQEDSEEFAVPSCSRQTMSPSTEDIDKADDSSVSEYDVTDDEARITATMHAEEEKIHQQIAKEENKEKIECMDEWATMQESQKFARLQHLLNKSNIYCQFLLKRMEEQREEENKRQKRIAKRMENKEIKDAAKQQQVQRRSARRKENDQTDSQGSSDSNPPEPVMKTKRGRKRKAEQSTSKISDYITEEAIVKRQKLNESKSPARSPLSARSPEQCVPNTPKSCSPRKDKSAEGEDVHLSQPSLMTGGVMRSYQIEGLEWLKVLYENGVNGILADEMGLGKTIQCIALIAHLIEMGVKGPFLVAAPLSTLPNWVSEFHRFTPKIPVILYHGSIEERTILRRKISKLVSIEAFVSQPVVITSYEICMNDQKYLYCYHWKHMIVDEGHRIKNLNCRLIRELKTYDSANRLLLTGTPLQNNLQELWSLLNFLLPDIFDDLSSFQRLFDFSAIGDEESKERILAQEREHQVLKTLHSILTPFLLRRLKTDVELSLPPKKELLVYAPLTNKQTTFYKAALDKTIENLVGPEKNKKKEIIEMSSTGRPIRKKRIDIDYKVFDAQDFEELSNTLAELRTARQPDIYTTNQKQQNSVVSIPLRNILMLLRKCCNHPYLLEYPLDPATQQFKIDEELVTCSGKMKILDQLLAGLKARGHKVLIFSQMTKMLDILEDFCYLRKYSYCRLDGAMSVQDRREQMKDFSTDPNVFLFLLSTRAGGLGLNLSAADTVIIYDSDWNPQADLQAQDRCHRIGQTKPIIVYRLVTANSVDQKMVERAASKRKLEKLVIHKGKFKGKVDDNVISSEELRELLEARSHDQVIANDGLLLSNKQLNSLLDRNDLIAKHKKKASTVPDVDNTDSTLFKVIDSSS